jgi:hypothetical protein
VHATVVTPDLHGSQPSWGQISSGALQAEINFAGAPGQQRAQVRFRGQTLAAHSAQYGRASAPALNGVLRWNAGAGKGRPAKLALRFNTPALQAAVPKQGEWKIGGASGALLLTGSVAGIVAVSKVSRIKDECPAHQCDATQRGALASSDTLANVANVTIPLGLLGIAYGVYEWLTLPNAPEPHARASHPVVDITGAGIQLRGAL